MPPRPLAQPLSVLTALAGTVFFLVNFSVGDVGKSSEASTALESPPLSPSIEVEAERVALGTKNPRKTGNSNKIKRKRKRFKKVHFKRRKEKIKVPKRIRKNCCCARLLFMLFLSQELKRKALRSLKSGKQLKFFY